MDVSVIIDTTLAQWGIMEARRRAVEEKRLRSLRDRLIRLRCGVRDAAAFLPDNSLLKNELREILALEELLEVEDLTK